VFEWDDEKNRLNIEKHGISFETAATIFRGIILSRIDDREDYGEVRDISIGRVDTDVVVTVVHTNRDGSILRLVSARRAIRRERKDYDEYCAQITR